ncbi:MAG: ABC transporter ATP-binding protein/permease [Saccharofermentans sp.]|nr:ABC transporter ATP-binding protein/permease [Saccharofermentans sp.]
MKNILKFLKGSELTVLLIVLLLFLQAYCDLSLPNYTSKLINVGLQQNGIEYAAPNTIREETMQALELFMPDEDVATFNDAYSDEDGDGIYSLKNPKDIEAVSNLLAMPESVYFQMSNTEYSEVSIEDIETAINMGLMTKEQFLDGINEKIASYGNLNESYLNQIAVAFVASEYEGQGLELETIRNHYLYTVGFKMILMTLFMSITAIVTGYFASKTSAKIGKTLRESLYSKVMKFTNAEMEKYSTASLITRSTNDIQQVQMVIGMILRMVAYAPILAIFGIIRVVQTRSGMSWIIVVAVITLCALVGILVAIAMPKFKQMQKLVDNLNLVSREILTGIMPIRAFTRELHEQKRFEKANKDLYNTQIFTNRAMNFMMPIMMFIMNGVSLLIVWVGSGRVDAGAIQVGDLTAFITYSMVIVMSFLMLSMISIILPRAGVAADRIVEVLNTDISLNDPKEARDEEIKNSKGRIAFTEVSFAYPGAASYALENLTFTAEPGQVTAIVGSTGCGKSTLLNLIPRFFDVTEGSITLDGVDIREVTQNALRSKIGYVPQKGMLFSGTIESNIKYGGEAISDEDMKDAASIAQAEEFINEKEEKYASTIAQEGSNVSGGQRQRLSIARAIAKKPQIYLFDDSFSALDYKTDLKLRSELMKRTQDSTVIIVAQRISTILHADKILCMDDGKIVGQGTHQELMKSCKTYMEIAKSQLSERELSENGGAL